MAAEVCAAIDVGSYEISMKIYELGTRKGVRELDHVRCRIDLGSESYATGRLGTAHVNEICGILNEFGSVMKTWGVTRMRACATSAVRESRNSAVVLEQIEKQLRKLVDVIRVDVLSGSAFSEREVALLKLRTATREERSQIIQLVEVFNGKIVSVSNHEIAVEISGKADRIDDFISLVRDFGIIDMARSGRVAIARCRE